MSSSPGAAPVTRSRKRERVARFVLERLRMVSRASSTVKLLALLALLVSVLLMSLRLVAAATLALVAVQLITTAFSIYVARRWVFVPRSRDGSTELSSLVMVRRRERRRFRPPQVVRWDLLGVLASSTFGVVGSIPLLRPLRVIVYRAWALVFRADLSEIDTPLTSFRSLQEFFGRPLRAGVRPLDASPLTSPSDGKVVIVGQVHGDRVEQVKGVSYSLTQFLGKDSASLRLYADGHLNADADDDDDDGYDDEADEDDASLRDSSSSTTTIVDAKVAAHESSPDAQRQVEGALVSDVDSAVDVLIEPDATVSEPAADLSPPPSSSSSTSSSSVGSSSSSSSSSSSLESAGSRTSAIPRTPLRGHSGMKTRLYHAVIYLAPGDYHRFHSPADFKVTHLRHFPGTLFPISPIVARLIPNLFALNERVVLSGSWEYGFFSMTAVGAYNVGSIAINFESRLRTNKLRRDFRCPNLELFSFGGVGCYAYENEYPEPIELKRGDEIGRFNLGSTIVLVFEAPENFVFTVGTGSVIKVGKTIGLF